MFEELPSNSECSEEDCLECICAGISAQNRALIARMDEPDFNPGVELDNTRNGAAYKLTDFFGAAKWFPHGEMPSKVTDEMVATTDELVDAIRRRYGDDPNIRSLANVAGKAFRDSKRLWRIRFPTVRMEASLYHAELDRALEKILSALDDLNSALDRLPDSYPGGVLPKPVPAATPRHYKTRTKITIRRAAEITGLSQRTIQNLLKDPRNTGFVGLNVEEFVLLAWALRHHQDKVRAHWANLARHPIHLADLPASLRRGLGVE